MVIILFFVFVFVFFVVLGVVVVVVVAKLSGVKPTRTSVRNRETRLSGTQKHNSSAVRHNRGYDLRAK
jgi:hypothetical protein